MPSRPCPRLLRSKTSWMPSPVVQGLQALSTSMSDTCAQLATRPRANAAACPRWCSLATSWVTMTRRWPVRPQRSFALPMGGPARALWPSRPSRARPSGPTARARLPLHATPMPSRSTRMWSFRSIAWATTPMPSSASILSCRSQTNSSSPAHCARPSTMFRPRVCWP